jgi:hypothetical protein
MSRNSAMNISWRLSFPALIRRMFMHSWKTATLPSLLTGRKPRKKMMKKANTFTVSAIAEAVREAFMYGKKVMEKIYVTDQDGKLTAHVFVKVEGATPVVISGTMPFEELTSTRMRIIKPIIGSMK